MERVDDENGRFFAVNRSTDRQPDSASGAGAGQGGSAAAQADGAFSTLPGRWVRPDGGYVITIRRVDADGKLDADYANPNPLPFSRAEATLDGKTIRLFFEIRAGGYSGSTYTLAYDPVADVLKGVYYQAVAQQKFDVFFTRAK